MKIAQNVETTQSREDENKIYVTYPDGLRLVFEDGKYAGWYICK